MNSLDYYYWGLGNKLWTRRARLPRPWDRLQAALADSIGEKLTRRANIRGEDR